VDFPANWPKRALDILTGAKREALEHLCALDWIDYAYHVAHGSATYKDLIAGSAAYKKLSVGMRLKLERFATESQSNADFGWDLAPAPHIAPHSHAPHIPAPLFPCGSGGRQEKQGGGVEGVISKVDVVWSDEEFAQLKGSFPVVVELCKYRWERRAMEVIQVMERARKETAPESVVIDMQGLLQATFGEVAFVDRREELRTKCLVDLLGFSGVKKAPFSHLKRAGDRPFPFPWQGGSSGGYGGRASVPARPCRWCGGRHFDRDCQRRGGQGGQGAWSQVQGQGGFGAPPPNPPQNRAGLGSPNGGWRAPSWGRR